MQYGSYYQNAYQSQFSPQFQGGYGNLSTPPIQAQNQPPVNSMGGFIPVQNENEARMYRLAPGTSATFIDENAPYCYTKTEGVSQLDRPIFKRFRLVEEVDTVQNAPERAQSAAENHGIDLSEYALKADMDALASRIAMIQTQIEKLNSKEDSGA